MFIDIPVGSNVSPSTTLLRYIREYAKLPGSKACCYEGGCGVCTVVATTKDLENGTQKSFSVRSVCMIKISLFAYVFVSKFIFSVKLWFILVRDGP